MAVFFNNSITDKGAALLAQVQLGAVFTPTKMVMGSGFIPEGQTTRTMTAVVLPEQEFPVTELKQTPSEASVIIGGVFTNKDVEESFYYRELGLYAKGIFEDGTETEEILYSYGNAGNNPDLIPAYSTETAIESNLRLIVYVGNDTEVRLEIESGAYVGKTEYDAKVVELEQKIQDAKVMEDETTGVSYIWGIENGLVFIQEV